jgi:hypothetical protein
MTEHSPVVERVARAICHADGKVSWTTHIPAIYYIQAEAAIKAMEPEHQHMWAYHSWDDQDGKHAHRECWGEIGCGLKQRWAGDPEDREQYRMNSTSEGWVDR